MKDAYEVLRQKEDELAQVRKEMESLKIVAGLLTDEDELKSSERTAASVQRLQQKAFESASDMISRETDSKMTGTDGVFSSVISSRLGFWSSLKAKDSHP